MADKLSKKNVFLKVLVKHFHPNSFEQVLAKGFSIEKAGLISKIPMPSVIPFAFLDNHEKSFSQIHYSWIGEAINKFPEILHLTLILSLPSLQSEDLLRVRNIKSLGKKSLPPVAKKFFLSMLNKKIEGLSETLKVEFLHETPLSALLNIDTHVLFEMFDLLGLYDLAIKLKYIIDKKIVSNVYKSLSPARKKFLIYLTHQKNKIQLTEMDLSSWRGDPLVLKKMIHRSGLLRLSKALSGCSPDFLWHLTHKLDTGRGRIILNSHKEEELPIAAALREQIFFIINILTKKKES